MLVSDKPCCGLRMPPNATVPHKFVLNQSHVIFLKWVDKLKLHPMFINHFNRRRWRVEPDNYYEITNFNTEIDMNAR